MLINPFALIAKLIFRFKYSILTSEQVDDYYKGLSCSHDLTLRLGLDSFKWRGELYLLDWDKTPNEALAVRLINCNDFARLYIYLFRLLNIPYHYYYMVNWSSWFNPQWHSICIFKENGQLKVQSNNTIFNINSEKEYIDGLKYNGYTVIKLIQQEGIF